MLIVRGMGTSCSLRKVLIMLFRGEMSKHIFKSVCGDREQRNPHAVREKVPENGTHKRKLCLRLSLKAIGERSSHDGIKDSY